MRTIELTLTPEEYFNGDLLRSAAAKALSVSPNDITHVEIVRRSLDSRRSIRYIASADVYMAGETFTPPDYKGCYKDCRNGRRVVIVGAGPAGLFAALRALELGLKPVIVERGKPVEVRKKDITLMVRSGLVNNDSNWCFGEGGAGTYSDGKLFTRSTKRGDIKSILYKFVEHGADPKIMIDAHAHIGTDRLSGIISAIRRTIIEQGGEIFFGKRVIDLAVRDREVHGVICMDGDIIEGEAVILATGHSARDIYELFHAKGWQIEAKPFALGVRIEHPQQLIDNIQYHGPKHSSLLPPASYSLTTQVDGHGVFSFCMCPGGIIVPAATDNGKQVVNGMSNASRSSAFANSGIAVTVSPTDIPGYGKYGVLSLLRFQQDVEHKAATATGGGLKAPCQRLTDFCEGKTSATLNRSNYMGECVSLPIHKLLPPFIANCLRQAFKDFGRKMHGFYTETASILAVESRTSSPIRIPRDEHGEHPQLKKLYPCGEGAGYAGGIVSSAIDGVNAVEHIHATLSI